MNARRPTDVVRALGGLISPEDAVRILGDPVLRRTVAAAWDASPPALEHLARALRKSAQGNAGPLRLVEELHIAAGGPGAVQTRLILAALHRWCLRNGGLQWFVERSPISYPTVELGTCGEEGHPGGLLGRWHRRDRMVTVSTPLALAGHQAVLLKEDALEGIDLLGPGVLGAEGATAAAVFGDSSGLAPRRLELFTRPTITRSAP